MKVLVIPDIHLKPWIFIRAAELMRKGAADRAVCLMDIADDWNLEMNLLLYELSYDTAITFAREFPDTLWCLGNHDLCYLWNMRESGYSIAAAPVVISKLEELRRALPEENRMAYVHCIDNVLFCHGGINDDFVRKNVRSRDYNNTWKAVEAVNALGCREMWQDFSPIGTQEFLLIDTKTWRFSGAPAVQPSVLS